MVLHFGQHDFVTRSQLRFAPTPRDEVDAFRSPMGEHNLLGRLGIEETADPLAGCLKQLRGLLAEIVYAAMYVGVAARINVDHCLDDLPGTLRCGGVVEIHQRAAAADGLRQDREILPQSLGVEARYCAHCHRFRCEVGGLTARQVNTLQPGTVASLSLQLTDRS